MVILIYSGYRINELLKRRDQVDLDKEILYGGMKTPTGKSRFLVIHPAIRPYVEYLGTAPQGRCCSPGAPAISCGVILPGATEKTLKRLGIT